MANLRILSDAEAFPLCRDDAFGITKTRKALADGREAYWSEHRYGQAGMIDLVDIANRDPKACTNGEPYGLHAACAKLAAARPEHAAANIAFFLSRIHPANQLARAALIRAEADYLATWTEAA